ncbi:hypothetical protein ACVR1I_03050 [Streptococcus cameli]
MPNIKQIKQRLGKKKQEQEKVVAQLSSMKAKDLELAKEIQILEAELISALCVERNMSLDDLERLIQSKEGMDHV